MGRAPAYVFVVRHGNRLDAANKQWHLQSPTPYDPPITYSGWNQARAVGQRIREILREREAQDEAAAAAGDGSPRRKRKFNIVLHSSPFLRCVQTSIGISAGLASVPGPPSPSLARTASIHSVLNPRPHPPVNTDVAAATYPSLQSFADLPTPPDGGSRPTTPPKHPMEKTVLRLDAFLGEWLTPGYFDLITPPPGSSLMLASAKAGLLRKEDYSTNPNFAPYNNAAPGAQTWGQPPAAITPASSLDNVSSLAEALRRVGESDSATSTASNGESRQLAGGAYVAPVPAYAISHNAEIPNGYVPHARDHCCQVDYQWDSMRGALDWGDGGALGEEWTSMHHRFRRGLQKLVDWYSTAENPTQMVTKQRRPSVTDDYVMVDGDEEEVEIESVVIIVSHGAGCNALIGALTHQPVLTDVGLASLTEAVRKPCVKDVEDGELLRVSTNGSNTSGVSGGLVTIHEHYDLKLFASTEHLSSGRLSRAPSVTAASKPPSRGRVSVTNNLPSPLSNTSDILHNSNDTGLFSVNNNISFNNVNPESRGRAATTSLSGLQRDSAASSRLAARAGLNTSGLAGGITVGSGVTSFLAKTPATGGLWSSPRSTLDTPEEEDDNFLPNFSSFGTSSSRTLNEREGSAKAPLPPEQLATPPSNPSRDRGDSTVSPGSNAIGSYGPAVGDASRREQKHEFPRPARQLGSGAGGLWGNPLLLEEEIPRDPTSPKRRWTVNERY